MMWAFLKYRMVPWLRKLRHNYLDTSRRSFSQSGEDLILQYMFGILGIRQVSYLDIGAHHPAYLSNTYLFYLSGGSGVCVEPDPELCAKFVQVRPDDVCLGCGVGETGGNADFYVMSTPTLNTFSRREAERYQTYRNHRIVKVLQVELKTLNQIIGQYFEKAPNLVSLDIEGMDFAVMSSFDFNTWRPEVFCLETLTYTEDKSERKLTELIELMHRNGYITYADTYINTIFVDAKIWKHRLP